MDDQATKDAAAKQRIVSHMNNDHHDSVRQTWEASTHFRGRVI